MTLVKEMNGWKLLKGDNLNDYTVELPDGTQQYYKFYLRQEEFDRAVNRGWIWIDKEYYVGTIINSKIEVEKRKKQIQSNKKDLFLKTHCTTKEQVINKLKPMLKEAIKKFKKCEKFLNDLQKELDFEVDYTMLGDTHGIYKDYLYISFNIDSVFCKFEIH